MLKHLGLLRTTFELALIGVIVLLLKHSPSSALFWRDSVVHGVPVKEKVVALTFDDGPDPRFTPAILAILADKQVKATFFFIGRQVQKYPALARAVVEAGHAIGNHTFSHPENIEALNEVQIVRELDRCEALIESFTGERTYLFRPPAVSLTDGCT